MSGGSHNYIYHNIEEELVGNMLDAELDDLMQDIANLAYSLEWADSGDTSIKDYKEDVKAFKTKWFKGNRNERLKGYVDERIDAVKSELIDLIGG